MGVDKGIDFGATAAATTYAMGKGGLAMPTPAAVDKFSPVMFGWLSAYLNHPEVGPILRRAAADPNYTPQRLQAELMNTNWWRSTSESQRLWDAKVSTDPASARSAVDQQIAAITRLARQAGIGLTADVIRTIATTALRNGWSDIQVQQAIGAEALKNPKAAAALGKGAVGRQAREMAAEYGIPMAQQSINSWATQIATGNATIDDLQTWLIGQAQALYPHLADELARGITVHQLADPYVQTAAKTLGLNPETMDFSEGKWNVALNYVDDKGKRRPMTLAEWQNRLMQDDTYGYRFTQDAQNKAYGVAEKLASMFGRA